MNAKELIPRFKSAGWTTDQEVDDFVAGAEGVAPSDVLRLLEAVSARSTESAAVRRGRCLAFGRLADRFGDKTVFVPFVRALKNADPPLRSILTQLIPRVNNVAGHGELAALLRSSDATLRATAAQLLGKIGGRSVFEACEQMIEEKSFAGRAETMPVLVALGGHHAVPALHAVLRVGSAAEKGQAIRLLADPRSLGRDPSRAASALASALGDPDEAIAAQAIAAFSSVCSEDDYLAHAAPLLEHPSVALRRAAVEGVRRFASPRAVAVVAQAMRRGPNSVRLAAVPVLEEMGIDAVLGPLAEALTYENLAVRTRAVEALQRLSRAGKLDLVRTIVWLLRSRDVNVRRLAAELAQSVPDRDALWPKLLEFLRDEDWWVRERVADALVEMEGAPLLRHVVPFLKEPDDLLRRFAVDVLLRLRAPESLGVLVRTAASDKDWWVRERAIEAVAALKDARAAPHIIDIMVREPELRLACLKAIADLPAPSAAAHVAALLSAADEDVTEAALRCLDVVGDAAQAPAVELLLADPRPVVRSLAREILLRWNPRATKGSLPPIEGLSRLDRLLVQMAQQEGDDLILGPDRPPCMKKLGNTVRLEAASLAAGEVRDLLLPLLSVAQREALQAGIDVDLSYEVKTEALRFRANVFNQIGGLAAVFRNIKGALLELDALGLPPAVHALVTLKHGLVLVGGPTGSGKSTTLAALIDRINSTSARHVISLEDPIEVMHRPKMAVINQREVGTHARSFSTALRSTLREDPDVILIGEMRDADTIAFALTAAETGHLVFGSIHTVSAATTVDRIISASPSGRQEEVRAMLAGSLRAVICQYLLRRADGPGRVLAVEVLLNNDAVANLIRQEKAFQIPSVITTSRESGMQLMDGELMRLFREGKISAEDAYLKAAGKKDFEGLVEPDARSKPPAG